MCWRLWFTLLAEAIVFSSLLFGAAGTIRWVAGWTFLTMFFGGAAWISLFLSRHDPALLAERMKLPVQKDQPLWDKVFLQVLLLAWLAWLVLTGLDAVRFHWTHMPIWLQCVGGAAMVVAFAIFLRIFKENTFLAAVVKIQKERGHTVVSTGPYAVVRHPLYAAVLLFLPATALLLGSWWGVAASGVLCAAIVFRTAMEDRELLTGLDGYAEYALQTRYRLVPRVW